MEAILALVGAVICLVVGFLTGWWLSGLRSLVMRYAALIAGICLATCVWRGLPDIACDFELNPPKFHFLLKNGLGWEGCTVVVITLLVLGYVWRHRDGLQESTSGQVSKFEREPIFQRLHEQAHSDLSRPQRRFLTQLLATGGVGAGPHAAKSLRGRRMSVFAWLLAWFMEPSREDRMYVFAWLRVRLRELTPEMKAEIGRLTVLIEDFGKMSSQLPEPPPTTGVNDG
jgi:hypothetical protein